MKLLQIENSSLAGQGRADIIDSHARTRYQAGWLPWQRRVLSTAAHLE